MTERDLERDPLTDGERARILKLFRAGFGRDHPPPDEERSILQWAARAKMEWLLFRAVLAGQVPVDYTMGDVKFVVSRDQLDRLVAEARLDIYP